MSGMTNPNGETELLPCPFCGGEASAFRVIEWWSVSCSVCECHTALHWPKSKAIARWNTRPQTGRER